MTPPAAAAAAPRFIVVLLGALIAFAPLSIDMYLPAFPAIARDFSGNAAAVQYTLAAYFVGMALGQAFHGPLSDRFGRKPLLDAGLWLYLLASVGCALAGSVYALIGFRFLQALGGCATTVIALAMVRDLYDHRSSARVLSRLILVMGVAPIAAPSLGAMLLAATGWRTIFWLLAACSAAALLTVRFALPETVPPERRQKSSLGAALRVYGALLRQRRFLGFALAGGLTSAGMFAYIAGSPFVLIELFGLSAQTYGWVFGANAFGVIAGSQLNHRLLATRHPDQVLPVALMVRSGFALALLLAGFTGWLGLPALLLPLFGFMAAMGFIGPNATAGAMASQSNHAGSASAVIGTTQSLFATVAGAMVGIFSDGSARPMVSVMAACAIGAALCYWWLVAGSKESAAAADITPVEG